MEGIPILSTESMSEYATQESVRSQSTLFTDAMRETQDFNLDPINEQPLIRDLITTEHEISGSRRFSSFSEDSKELLPPIDSDDEEDAQDDLSSSTIKKGKK